MEPSVFEEASEILPTLVPRELGVLRQRAKRYGMKVWFDAAAPTREHYEAQVVGARDVPEARVLAIEVGFHTEYPQEVENEAVLQHLLDAESVWGEELDGAAVGAVFLGRATKWRRLSETWLDPDLGAAGLSWEIATRLTDYITTIEPLRRRRTGAVTSADARPARRSG